MFLLVPAYPGCPGSKAVKRSLLLLLYFYGRVGKIEEGRGRKSEGRDGERPAPKIFRPRTTLGQRDGV